MMAVETLNAWGAAWAWFMLRALVDSSILLAVVVLIWLPLRRKMSAQFAHGLFLLVLLKLAVPIPASWPSWSAEAPVKRIATEVSTWVITADPEESTISDPHESMVVASSPEPIVAAASVLQPSVNVADGAVQPAEIPTRARIALNTPAILMIAWGLISVLLLLRFLGAVLATRRLIRQAVVVPDGADWFPVSFETLRQTAGVRSTVRWAVSAKITSPAVGGLLRPTIVMPPDLDDGLTPKQLNWVLLHELAHVRRKDLWVVTIQRLVGAVFFFHPAVHLANWIIDQLREYACDDAALAAAHASRHACGEGFLTIVGRTVEQPPAPMAALGLFESRMLIHRRLLRILDGRRTVHERLSPLATLTLVGMALVVLPYGRSRDAAATLTLASSLSTPEEPRQFALTTSFLHDDRASSAGKPRSPVLAVAYSPDGSNLATAGEDGAIVLRDPATGSVRLRLEGHTDVVTGLAFSPDGRTVASSSYDKSVRLWDLKTGQLKASLLGHLQWIHAVAFSPDGTLLASAGSDKTVRLWDVASGRLMTALTGPTSAIRTVAFSPDGRTLASAGTDGIATLWDIRRRVATTTFRGHRGTIRALAFAPDGKTLASAGEDSEIKLWNPKTGTERTTLTGHSDMVLALSFSSSGSSIASGGLDSAIKLWDVGTGRERGTLISPADGVPALAFAPNARQFASTGYDGTVKLWDAAAPSLSAAATLEAPGEGRAIRFTTDGKSLYATGSTGVLNAYDPAAGLRVGPTTAGVGSCMDVSPDGRTFAVGGPDGKVRVFDAPDRREIASLEGHEGEVRCVSFIPKSSVLASGGADGEVLLRDLAVPAQARILKRKGGAVLDVQCSPEGRTLAVATEGRSGEVSLFDVASGDPCGSLPGRGSDVSSVAFSPDARTIATVGLDGAIVLFDLTTRTQRTSWSHPEGRSVAFSPDGRFLATGHRTGDLVLWDASNGLKVATLKGHHGQVSDIVFAPDGRTIASTGRDKTVRLWNLGARRVTPRASLNGDLACIGPVVVSPDGQTLAVAEVAYDSPGHIVLWDLTTRRVKAKLHGHERGVASLAFSPDGKTLASSSWDLSIRTWNAKTGEARGEFATTEAVSRLAFSPDGKTLVSAGEEKILTFWEVESGSEIARIDGFKGPIFALAFRPDGRRIATGGGLDGKKNAFGEVKVFDAQTHEELVSLGGHTASVRSLAYSADGSTLASGGVDSTVRIWDEESGKARLVIGGFSDCVRAIGLSPDGRSLAVSGRGDGVVSLLDATNGGEISRLVGHGNTVLGLSFMPDGRTLVSGGLDATIKLWDVPSTRTGSIVRR